MQKDVAPRLADASRGSPSDFGQMLQDCRNYLLLVANQELDDRLAAKTGASDLVQETFLEAHRAFPGFAGGTRTELLAWLRRILLNNLANLRRRYMHTAARQVCREQPLEGIATSRVPWVNLLDDTPSPSARLIRDEEAKAVAAALNRLSEDHRLVLTLRHRDQASFREIGARMDRSEDAARMLWWRAVERLAAELERSHESQ